MMVFCDCIEVARAGGIHSEVVLTMKLLLSTLFLLCKCFPWKFFSEVSNSTTVLSIQIFITVISIIWFVQSISLTFIYVLLSGYFETKWWITLSQYFLFSVLNKVWVWVFFVFSKVIFFGELQDVITNRYHQILSCFFSLGFMDRFVCSF